MTALITDAAGNYKGFFDITFANALGDTFADSAPVGSSSAVTPEPGSWLLLSTGLAGVWLLLRRFLTRMALVSGL